MLWDVGTVAITIDARGWEIMDTARLQRCYGMLLMPFQNENNRLRNAAADPVVY